MSLDLDTLQFATLSSRISYVFVFALLTIRHRNDDYIIHWLFALICSIFGSLIMFSRPMDDILPPVFGMLVYGFFGASLALSWSGLRRFHELPVHAPSVVTLAVLPGLVYGCGMTVGPGPRISLALVFLACALPTWLSLYECLRAQSRDRLWSQYFAIVAFSVYFMLFVLSVVILTATDRPMMSIESAKISLAIDQVAGILIHFAYLAMAGERSNLRLARLSQRDPLTRLFNRRGLSSRLSRIPVAGSAVLLADIDHFKAVNDRMGHAAGDEVLAQFAVLMSGVLRKADLGARWGGEEFLAVLPATGAAEALAIAERLRLAASATPVPAGGTLLPVTVSIGVAVVDEAEADIGPATARADAALYRAKAGGRNRVCGLDLAPSVAESAAASPRRSPGALTPLAS